MKYKLSLALSICLMSNFALATDDVNLSEVTTYGNLSTTEGTGSYTTGNMSTATGLNLSIRETPQSVSVVSNQVIKDLNLNSVDSALSYAPGITVRNDTGRLRINSRGFDVDNIQEDGIASSVSSSVQGPLGFSKEFTDLEFYDRVEVLRGAAGLTQSNGEPGGTVNLVRKRPSSELGINASLSAGSWDNYRSTFDITNALNESGSIRGRLIGVLSKNGTYKNYDDGWRGALGGIFEFDLTDATLLTTGLIWQKTKEVYDIYGVPAIDSNGNYLNLSRKSYFGANWNNSIYEKYNAFAEISHNFNDDFKAYAKLNYTKSDGMIKFGSMGGVSPYNGTTSHDIRFRKYDNSSDEVNLKLGLDGKYELFGRKHDFFINGQMSREVFEEQDKWSPDTSLTALGLGIYNWNSSIIPQPDWDSSNTSVVSFNKKFTNTIYQQAFALGTRYNFTDDWHLLVGGRFSRVKYDKFNENYIANTRSNNTIITKSKFTPYAGLTWDFTKNHSWYVSYAEIFKPQSATDKNKNVLDPVVGYNIETGLKSEYFDGALNTAIALFQVIQENRAMTDPTDSSASIAEGKVRSRGIDVEISGAITDRWNIFSGYTYNKSIYMKSEKENSTTVDYSRGADAKKYIPRHLFKIYTSYELPINNTQKISFGTGVRFQSKTSGIYVKNNLSSGATIGYYVPEQKAYALWDANINYTINKNFSVALAVKNITDKKYFVNTHNRTAGMNNFYGDPRNFMLTLNYTY
ncbi:MULTISPECIES: TonB-dependent siderophore receptor [Campylobacter]|uniref:TonB-dependent ferric coprogen/ferric rhodotorulic acid receptor n=1 Tax=Campylobacter curvus (strain 525.92) TaxID=360105 RepID=A7H0B7_CAMC5|nr:MULTISPECIES: TonB-dependent siderophore receptor [Campylobacter]EAT99905.1 putative TonB-dependent ferric coprogen/ferric rhodotorulic acid receptor [Campylobacter curvus 525.92]EJP74850.1 TonB-dependent siderophore receptor [Campylobacter sp. FOBRC14]